MKKDVPQSHTRARAAVACHPQKSGDFRRPRQKRSNYDELLMRGSARLDARALVREKIDQRAGHVVLRVRDRAVLGPIGVKRCGPLLPRVAAGVTLVELLCVICILAILASLLLPAVARAYGRARGFAEEFEAPEVASMLCHSTRNYCAANPQFQFTSKTDFADKCRPTPKCRDWIEAGATEFIPFDSLTPTNQIVLQVHLGPRHRTLYSFTRGDLSTRPEDR